MKYNIFCYLKGAFFQKHHTIKRLHNKFKGFKTPRFKNKTNSRVRNGPYLEKKIKPKIGVHLKA
jgi:hypothetical protein